MGSGPGSGTGSGRAPAGDRSGSTAPVGRIRPGRVVAFDERRGLGEVEADATGERFAFHCTRIAGGTRRIAVGAAVHFEVGPGLPGRWEAVSLSEMSPTLSPTRPGAGDR